MATLAERFPQQEPRRPKIPGYEIGEVLGRGATGVVFRARQQAVDREVALKVLHPGLSDQPRVIQRLQREARTTARLAHPHVVSAIDMGQTGGQWWYAMEFVDGPSLATRLRQEGRLKEREALRLFIPLCEALEHLWEHGVVHRDIKPANILIDRAGGARLADLGLAFADDDPSVTKQGGTLGTPHYISPEQTVDPTQADARSDIWSFGATLFHAVCGRTPFTGESAAEILSNVLYSRVPDPRELEPSLSKGLTLVLRKCLTREPEGRYQTPHELLLDMERVRERRQPKVIRRALDPVQKERAAWKIWLPVAAIVLLGVGIPFLLLGPLTRSSTGAGPGSIGQRGELLPYRPLEDLAERSRSETEPMAMLAQHRSELAALRRNLPPSHEPRWKELDREFSAELGRRVRELRNEAKIDILRELEAQDYRAASAILELGFPERVFDRTGYHAEQLEAEGVPIAPWVKVQRKEIDRRATAAAEGLQEALGNWSASVRAEVDRLKAAQQWAGALELLVEDRDAILAAADLASFPLPEALLDAAVDNTRTEMFVKRLEVKHEWTKQDQNLHRWVAERTDSLRRELESGPPRPPVAENLADAFERELERRRLSRAQIESLPRTLQRTCLEELDRSVSSLRALEEKWLEEDARRHIVETDRFCAPLWSTRRYEEAEGLWREALLRLRELEERTSSAWRSELEAGATIRREEALLLVAFLDRIVARVRELDGEVIDSIRPGLVDYFNVRIESGDDPLAEGFRAEGVRDTLYLRQPPADTPQPAVLRSEQIEKFYAGGKAGLSEVERLTLAAFRFYEGRFDDARAMLRSGPLPEEGVQAEIQADLLKRVFDSIEVDQAELGVREAEADDYLARIDEESQARAPSAVRQRVDLLITKYADLPRIRERLPQLRALSKKLRQQEEPSVEDRIKRVYDPSEIVFPSSREVVMVFDFDSRWRGAWQRGDWIFDGGGWARTDKVQRWDELADQRGPRLFLNEPLDPDSLQVEFTFEQGWPGPPQLVLISVGGFHVAFCGSGLPGEEHTPRYLIGTGDLEEFVQRIRSGEGTPDDRLVRRDGTHTVRLFVYRPGGSGSRLKLEFDDRLLDEMPRALAREDVPSIEFRSWEPVTLKRVVIETGR